MADTHDIRTNVENAASQAGEKFQQATSSAMSKAQELAGTASKRVDEATAALGKRVKSTAGSLRERGPQEGMLGTATGGRRGFLGAHRPLYPGRRTSGHGGRRYRADPPQSHPGHVGRRRHRLLAGQNVPEMTMRNDTLNGSSQPSMTTLVGGILTDVQELITQQTRWRVWRSARIFARLALGPFFSVRAWASAAIGGLFLCVALPLLLHAANVLAGVDLLWYFWRLVSLHWPRRQLMLL